MKGGQGDDSMYGEDDNDSLQGQEGNDTLRGGPGDDDLSGSENAIPIEDPGLQDDDKLYGGARKDTLFGAYGIDEMYGGNDKVYADGFDGPDADFVDCGGGKEDYVRYDSLDTVVNCENRALVGPRG